MIDIQLKSEPTIGKILDEYCENVTSIPTWDEKKSVAISIRETTVLEAE
jgi:hypothetical protein